MRPIADPPPLRFVFLIPAESGEKITLGISTMLNMTVTLLSEKLCLYLGLYISLT